MFKKLSDLELLTLCIYGEARGEGLDGMLAVGSVVSNRGKNPCWWGHNIQQVILKPHQLSCFNEGDPNRDTIETIAEGFNESLEKMNVLRNCYWIAKGILEGYLTSNVGNANHYHTKHVNPAWNDKMRLVNIIGNHKFYYGS